MRGYAGYKEAEELDAEEGVESGEVDAEETEGVE